MRKAGETPSLAHTFLDSRPSPLSHLRKSAGAIREDSCGY